MISKALLFAIPIFLLFGCDTWNGIDKKNGLAWGIDSIAYDQNINDSATYCSQLTADGFDTWRVPTIDELRTLFRDCPATQKGGECRASSNCTTGCNEGWDDTCTGVCFGGDSDHKACVGCASSEGPGIDGAHTDYALGDVCGPEGGQFWTTPQWSDSGGGSACFTGDLCTGAIFVRYFCDGIVSVNTICVRRL